MKNKDLSVIIPYYNSPKHLKRLLDSLAASNFIDDCEIIIVDDGSPFALQNNFMDNYPILFAFHRLEKNSGPAAARNYGASLAQTTNLLFLDADTVVYKDTLKHSIAVLKNKIIFVGNVSSELVEDNFFQKYKSYIELYWKPDEDYTTVAETKIFGIPKNIFEEVGGFNTNYKKADVEDYEFGYRLMKKKHKISFEKDIIVKHHHADFFSFFRKCFERVYLWVILKKYYNRSFDNHGTSMVVAAGQILGFLSMIFFIGVFFNSLFIFFFAVSIILFFIITRKLWKIIFANKENVPFVLYTLFCYLVLTIPVIIGAMAGYIAYYLGLSKKIKKDEFHSF